MKLDINELINRLNEIKREHGNMPVMVRDKHEVSCFIHNVDYHNLTTYIEI